MEKLTTVSKIVLLESFLEQGVGLILKLCTWQITLSTVQEAKAPIFLEASLASQFKILIQEHSSNYTRLEQGLIILAETRRMMLNESGTSTHKSHSDAGDGTSHNPEQPRFMRIGQWPTKLTSALATPSTAPETHSAIHRTVTDLQNEEIAMDTIRSSASSDGSTQSENDATRVDQPHGTASNEGLVEIKDSGHSAIRNYYHFEWFRILVSMIFIIISEVIIYGLSTYSNIVSLWQIFLGMAAMGLVASILYTGLFVILMEYNVVMENFVQTYARLQPGLQHICLRVCAYLYACGVIGGIAYLGYWYLWQL